jgi:hypothetical protein
MNNIPKWTLTDTGSALVVGSGNLFFKEKRPQGINYETLMKLIKANPNNDLYQVKIKRRLTLGKAIEMNMLDKIGEEIEFSTTINIHTLIQDRDYSDLPQTGKELITHIYESKAYIVDET